MKNGTISLGRPPITAPSPPNRPPVFDFWESPEALEPPRIAGRRDLDRGRLRPPILYPALFSTAVPPWNLDGDLRANQWRGRAGEETLLRCPMGHTWPTAGPRLPFLSAVGLGLYPRGKCPHRGGQGGCSLNPLESLR